MAINLGSPVYKPFDYADELPTRTPWGYGEDDVFYSKSDDYDGSSDTYEDLDA